MSRHLSDHDRKKESGLKIFLIGSGGHAKCVHAALLAQGLYEIVGLITEDHTTDLPLPIVATEETREAAAQKEGTRRFILAFGGDLERRRRVFEDYLAAGWEPVNIIHPSVILGPDVRLGRGILIEAGAILTPDPVIGDNVIINPGVLINHDNVIGSHTQLATGTATAGGVEIGEGVFIGTGVSFCPRVRVASGIIVGAGACVTQDLLDPGTYVGVPARRLIKEG